MSDDGRTTGKLMKAFQEELGLHLPPPGDLRRCLFMMSDSKKRDLFQQYLETVIEKDTPLKDITVEEYFRMVGADNQFIKLLEKKDEYFLKFTLPLSESLKGHKMGNLLMANLYYNLDTDYNKMLKLMHELLEVRAHIIPVTTGKAFIKAIL